MTATLAQLRQAEAELRAETNRQRAYFQLTGRTTRCLAELAEKLSSIQKEIGARTVGRIFRTEPDTFQSTQRNTLRRNAMARA